MKRVFMGAGALALAVGAVAFTTAPRHTASTSGTYYFAVTSAGVTAIPETTLQTSPASFGCTSGSINCAAPFTGNFVQTSLPSGKWQPTSLTQQNGEGTVLRKH